MSMERIRDWLQENRITEVECLVPDMMLQPDPDTMRLVPWAIDTTSGKNIFSLDDGSEHERFAHFIGGLQKYTPGARQ
jgi:glutamine synthetase